MSILRRRPVSDGWLGSLGHETALAGERRQRRIDAMPIRSAFRRGCFALGAIGSLGAGAALGAERKTGPARNVVINTITITGARRTSPDSVAPAKPSSTPTFVSADS